MSLLSRVESFFAPKPQAATDFMAVDAIFTYMLSHIREESALNIWTGVVAKAHAAPEQARMGALLHAYLDLEHFLVTNQSPITDKAYTEEALRKSIRDMLGENPLPPLFTPLFLLPAEQKLNIYASATEHLQLYLQEYIGAEKLKQFLNTHGATGTMTPEDYRKLYASLFEELATLLGRNKALERCRREYEFFKTTYDAAITSQFLTLLPETVLEVEQLAFMSREELERKITERTEALGTLNSELEVKVRQRTEELNEKVEELSAANKHLLELDQVKTEFISIAAHQLRTPLTALKWSLSMLSSEKAANLTEEQKSLIVNGYESNERMISLINEMLTVVSIESGQMIYALAPTYIEEVIESVVHEFAGLSAMRDISITFHKPEPPMPAVMADADKIRSVLQNLTENALNYSANGTHVTISAKVEDAFVVVSVSDEGIGIPANQRASIFDKLYRADNAVSMRTSGSGLGLFIAKSIVEKHKGTIGFDSVEGKGTTFYFKLPIAVDKGSAS